MFGTTSSSSRRLRSHEARDGRRADRRADHRQRPRARRGRAAGRAHAGRNLAGERGRPLPAPDDQHDAPLDPNFNGGGRTLTDAEGRYRFVTIKPGAYPWRNHYNAWRPAHIHFSLFGPAFATRLVTQMYFPGDPLLDDDPMYTSIADEKRAPPADLGVRLGDDVPGAGARLPVRHRAARPRGDADGQLRRETSDEPADDGVADGRPVPAHRARLAHHRQSRRRAASAASGSSSRDASSTATASRRRRTRRDLAGERARSLRTSGRHAGQAARARLQGIRARADRRDGGFRFTTIKPGRVPARRRRHCRRRTSACRSSCAGC